VQEIAKSLIKQIVESGGHDLSILPSQGQFRVYFRGSSGAQVKQLLSASEGQAVISHFKFQAGMNVGEKRRPQLGAVDYVYDDLKGLKRRLRLSTVGDVYGQESLVIRVLHDQQTDQLDFWNDNLNLIGKTVVKKGLFLFSGPVGSGKTTLMYHLARRLFKGKQIITIEDPVEIEQTDFLQLQINDAIGSTYDALIKLSLRHMPDLVIIGEIRDSQTAHAVIRAAMAGYTVFSTIHAKSIPGVIGRLEELGISQNEIDNALSGVVHQRLIAGKGVIDFETHDFKNHSSSAWNAVLEGLVNQGIIAESIYHAETLDD
jgi:competence protein ComGA